MEIFGIGNCDTCRKARKWLEQRGREHRWHDLRADGVGEARLRHWIEVVGPEKLVNRRSATWRMLGEDDRARALDTQAAPALLAAYPTLIKRPVIELDDRILVGFNDSVKQSL